MIRNQNRLPPPPRRIRIGSGVFWTAAFALVLAVTAPAVAPPAVAAPQTQSAGQEAVEKGESLASKLTVRGYLSVAWGITDGNQILGLNQEGTADYRTGALQLRFAATEKNAFVAQIEHERIGDAPAKAFRDDAELDWLFYERRFGDATALRVGKYPVPKGIYNGIQDVGTVLPFYRPPVSVYTDASFSTETLRGLLLSHRFLRESDWGLQVEGYYGEEDTIELVDGVAAESRFHNVIGLQTWLSTPVRNLRFGFAAQDFSLAGEVLFPAGERNPFRLYQGSVDYSIGRLTVRSELVQADFDDGIFTGGYLELGFLTTKNLSLQLQYEKAHVETEVPFQLSRVQDRDVALGARYSFSSQLVVKGELHWNRGFGSKEAAGSRFEPLTTRYGLVTLALSF